MRAVKEIDHALLPLSELKQRLDPLVARVRRTFEWYDTLLVQAGYDLDRDPQRLPYIDEQILTQHYYEARNPKLDNCHAYYTSGTATGARKRILYSSEDHDLYVDQRCKIFARFLTPKCKTACSDLGTGHAASSAIEIFAKLGLDCFQIDFRRPVREHVALLNEQRPDVLFTMPMVLDSLIQSGGLKFQPRKIITVGDVVSPAWKKRIAEFFSLQIEDLLDVVGSIEVGSIAYACLDCGLYHFDDHIIPETVRPSELYEGFTDPGKAEILVLTSLARSVFPAVRFITNDLVEGFTRGVCRGSKRYSFERIVGRTGSDFKNGENISLYDVNEAVNTFLPASPFEVRKESGKVTIRVCSPDFTIETGERIKKFLKELNPNSFQMVDSSLVADIEVCNVPASEISTSTAKRLFLVRKTDVRNSR
jgi:phenylacetate-coenzyme A ligase PaaK-like adenylate-forming protein